MPNNLEWQLGNSWLYRFPGEKCGQSTSFLHSHGKMSFLKNLHGSAWKFQNPHGSRMEMKALFGPFFPEQNPHKMKTKSHGDMRP